jgi:hypothetical protein
MVISVLSHLPLMATNKAKPVVSILGDSYSTLYGYNPEGQAPFYSPTIWQNNTDVDDVKQTWWWQVINEGGFILGVNDSWGGSTISFSGYNGEDYSERSFITRLPRLGSPDILLIFGATNDNATGGPLGDFNYGKLSRGHLYEFRPAMAKLLSEAQNRFPGTRIIFMVNDCLSEQIESSIIEVCKHYGVEYIKLEGIELRTGHPTIKGMITIKNQVLDFLKR